MVTGHAPWGTPTKDDYFFGMLCEGKYSKYWRYFRKDLSDEFKDLFIRMVHINPDERLDITEVVNHPWIVTHIEEFKTIESEQSFIN